MGTVRRYIGGKLYSVNGKRVSSSSKSQILSNQNKQYSSIASKQYGKDYSKLSANQQQQVRASYEAAKQRLKIKGKTTSQENIRAEYERNITEEAKQRTAEQTRENLQSREDNFRAAQAKNITKSQTIVPRGTNSKNITTQQITAQSTRQQTSTQYNKDAWSLEKAQQPSKDRYESDREFQEFLNQPVEIKERDYSQDYAFVRFDKNLKPMSVGFVDEKTETFVDETGKEVSSVTYSTPQFTFADAILIGKDIEKRKEKTQKDFLKSQEEYLQNKTGFKASTIRGLASFRNQKITRENIDAAEQVFLPAQTEFYGAQETSLSYTPQLASTNPQAYRAQSDFLSLKEKRQDFYGKEGVKAGAKVAVTAATISFGAPLIAKAVSWAPKLVTTGSTIIKGVYGTTVAYRGTKIVTGKGISFRDDKGNIALPRVVNAYEGKGTKRVFEALDLGAELAGVYFGAKSVKSKSLDPTTYKTTKSSSTTIKQDRVILSNKQVTAKPKGFKTTETGTIQTYGGKQYDVKSTYTYDVRGEGTYRVDVLKGRGSKPVFSETGTLSMDSSIYSPTNIKVVDLGEAKLIYKTSPVKPTKTFTVTEFKEFTSGGSSLYATAKDPFVAGSERPYKFMTDAVLKGKVKTTTLSSKGNIQSLKDPTREGQSFFEKVSSSTLQVRTGKQPSYKFTEIKTNELSQQKFIKPETESKLFGSSFTEAQTSINYVSKPTKVNLKPFYNLQAMGTKGQTGRIFTPTPTAPTVPKIKPIVDVRGVAPLGLSAVTTIPSLQVVPFPTTLAFEKAKVLRNEGRTKAAQALRLNNISINKSIPKSIIDTTPKEDVLTSTSIGTSTKQSQAQDEINETVFEPPVIVEPIPQPITSPPTFIRQDLFFKTPDLPDFERKKKKGLFDIFVRRKGKFIDIGDAFTLKEAKQKGKGFVKSTSAASFQIVERKTGTKVAVTDLGKEFRTSKTDPFTFVQKRSFRIKSSGEKREITAKGISASKVKRGTKKWKI